MRILPSFPCSSWTAVDPCFQSLGAKESTRGGHANGSRSGVPRPAGGKATSRGPAQCGRSCDTGPLSSAGGTEVSQEYGATQESCETSQAWKRSYVSIEQKTAIFAPRKISRGYCYATQKRDAVRQVLRVSLACQPGIKQLRKKTQYGVGSSPTTSPCVYTPGLFLVGIKNVRVNWAAALPTGGCSNLH